MSSSNNTNAALEPPIGYRGQAETEPHNKLPEKPLVVIAPSRSWVALNLRDLWNYRDLLYILTMRDVKVRYKQTVLGAAWAIMQPLFTMIIFSLIFGRLAGIPSDNVPYPLFAFAGLLPWTFFSNAVTNSGNSLVGNSNLVSKVYFPRMIIPIAAVVAGLVDFGVAFGLLAVLMVYYGVALSPNLLMLPILIALTGLLAVGVGMWMSALNVKYRDVRYALPFLIQLWFFASPIIYPTSLVPEKYRWITAFNPMFGLIDGYRASLFNQSFDWTLIGASALITFAILIYAAYTFRRMERSFADVI
jgi:lipopolysaccharide transport system permease protein